MCLIHFIPYAHAAEVHPYIVLFSPQSSCVYSLLLLLCFPVVSQVIECTAFSVPFCFLCILSVSKQKVPEFCTVSFPPPPILMGVKGELSKGTEVCICMSMGERRCPYANFFHQAESHIYLEVSVR